MWWGLKNWGGEILDLEGIAVFCLEKRLSKHKMTIFSKNLGVGACPFGPHGYAYGLGVPKF